MEIYIKEGDNPVRRHFNWQQIFIPLRVGLIGTSA